MLSNRENCSLLHIKKIIVTLCHVLLFFRYVYMAPRGFIMYALWILSVRKVVPTLTSTSAEIYLSMAGAKQLDDTTFILVPARTVRPAGVCSRHCIALHLGACRGELQSKVGEEGSPQVPKV
jgi:hypothetical protein